jgi:hypothetical protein
MRRLLPWLMLFTGGVTDAAITDLPGKPQVRVEISRTGGLWDANFYFDRGVTAWVFPRSGVTREGGKPWRQDSWSVRTEGVRLQRHGNYDVLVAHSGEVPKRVTVRFEPVPDGLRADYPPALVFTDGSVALFVAQFECFPMDSMSDVRKLPSDLNNQPVPAADKVYAFKDSLGPVLLEGRRQNLAETSNPGTYALFGLVRPMETPAMTGIIDSQLPAWVKESLSRSVPAVLSRYTQELGPLPNTKPTIMASWAGPTPGVVSRGGSVLRGLIVMQYEGSGMLQETDAQRNEGLWFIAHEAAHFWMGQTVTYQYARDAWITEGGAELLAIRAVAETDPDYDPRAFLNKAIEDCIRLTRRQGVESARERGEQRAYYACGAMFGLIAEAGSGRSFYRFVRQLIDANRADRVVTRADWLLALDNATRRPSLSRDIARLLDRGASDPGEFITDLLERAGLDIEVDATGTPRLR